MIYRQKGDLIKAEKLAREFLRIRTPISDSKTSFDLLVRILSTQGKLGNETRELYERSLCWKYDDF
jgi:hypothetical protein